MEEYFRGGQATDDNIPVATDAHTDCVILIAFPLQWLADLRGVDQIIYLLNPTGHVMHQQFNIQQLYVVPTLYLCVLYLSENKQWLVPLTA